MAALDVQPQNSPVREEENTLSQACVHRANSSSTWLAIATLGLGAFTLNLGSCAAPPMQRFLDGSSMPTVDRPQNVLETIAALERVEQQLQRMESMRSNSMVLILPFITLNSKIRESYDQAVECHRDLCQTACTHKERLLLDDSCPAEDVKLINDWAGKTESDLGSILELADHVRSHNGSWKSGWVAPSGYEFIKPLN